MRWEEIEKEPCAIARTLAIIGDRWTMLVLRNAFMGTRRFDAFQKQLDVTRHLLTDRLNTLVENDILKKVPYQDNPVRHEYRLTEKGLELYPVLITMTEWGNKWLTAEEDGPFLEFTHRTCGHKMKPELTCNECGVPVRPRDIRPQAGQGLAPYLQNPDFQERWSDLIKRPDQP